MNVTIQTNSRLSRPERERAALALHLALAPFQARVARASLRVEHGRGLGASEASHARVTVTLRPSGLLRVEARDTGGRSCAEVAIRRAAVAVARYLGLERQELLELLFLTTCEARGWPVVDAGSPRRRRFATRAPEQREAGRPGRASRRRSARLAA